MSSYSASDPLHPAIYEIVIGGRLDPTWQDWFAGMTVVPLADGDTLLVGPIADQAALHGVLKRVRDLGIPLVSVNRTLQERRTS